MGLVRELGSEVPEQVSEQRSASLLAEIAAAKRALEAPTWRSMLPRHLRSMELPGAVRSAWALGDRMVHRLIWRAKGWVERSPRVEARLRRYLWRFENRGLGVRLKRKGLSLRGYLVSRGTQRPGA